MNTEKITTVVTPIASYAVGFTPAAEEATQKLMAGEITPAEYARIMAGEEITFTEQPVTETVTVGFPEGSLCESGWTGDRCTYPLFHEGGHSND